MAKSALWFLVCSALLAVVMGGLDCEDLAIEDCAFAVSQSGARCVLEKRMTDSRGLVYECQTSSVVSDKAEPWVETDQCIQSCGLQRISVGISSDSLLQREFVEKWCSSDCQENCPNLVELFVKLAAGEDIQMGHVCNFLAGPGGRHLAEGQHTKATMAAINTLQASAAMPPISLAAAPMVDLAAAPAPF